MKRALRTPNSNNPGEPWQRWLLNSGSALLRLKCLFTLEVLIAHLCLYIHEKDHVHQGDLVCFLSQHKEVSKCSHLGHTYEGLAVNEQQRTLSADSAQGLGVSQKPQETPECSRTAEWFQALSLASSVPCFLTLTLPPTSESSLSPPALTQVL